jgi:hypothetical protein
MGAFLFFNQVIVSSEPIGFGLLLIPLGIGVCLLFVLQAFSARARLE